MRGCPVCELDLDRPPIEDGSACVPVLADISGRHPTLSTLREFLVATVADHKARTARVSGDLGHARWPGSRRRRRQPDWYRRCATLKLPRDTAPPGAWA